jgi:hypothetical protein
MQARLDAAELAFADKVQRVALYVRGLLGDAAVAEAEEARLKKRRAALEKKAAWLKDVYLRHALESQQKTEVRGALATVKIGINPPAVTFSGDVDALPSYLVRITPEKREVDKKAALLLWKEKAPMPPGLSVERATSVKIT